MALAATAAAAAAALAGAVWVIACAGLVRTLIVAFGGIVVALVAKRVIRGVARFDNLLIRLDCGVGGLFGGHVIEFRRRLVAGCGFVFGAASGVYGILRCAPIGRFRARL